MALQGFVESEYLAAKLAALAADQVYSADWIDKTTNDLKVFMANVGFTPEEHYQAYGWKEGLGPNGLFNPEEYKLAKAINMFETSFNPDGTPWYRTVDDALDAFEDAWPYDPYLHYIQYGSFEGINPSNLFDESSYLAAKLQSLQTNAATAQEWAGKDVDDVLAAFKAAGLSVLGHYYTYGQFEGLVPKPVPLNEQVGVFTFTVGEALEAQANNELPDEYSIVDTAENILAEIDDPAVVNADVVSVTDTRISWDDFDALSALENFESDETLQVVRLTSDKTAVNEGDAVSFTLETMNIAPGTVLNFTIGGDVDTNDILSGSLSGQVTIDADGKAVIQINLVADSLTEGTELLELTIAGQTVGVDVADTSTTVIPTYALAANVDEINEGQTVQFLLTTTDVAPGTELTYFITGDVDADDIVGGQLSGTAVVDAQGNAIIEITLVEDAKTEGTEELTLNIAGQAATVFVLDTSIQGNTLTIGADNLTGRDGVDDIFYGPLDSNILGLSSNTFQPTDQLNGGADSNNSLIATVIAQGTNLFGTPLAIDANTVNVQNMFFTATGGLEVLIDAYRNASWNMADVEEWWSIESDTDLTVRDATLNTLVGMDSTAEGVNFTVLFRPQSLTGNDAVDIVLNNVGNGEQGGTLQVGSTTPTNGNLGLRGIETFNVLVGASGSFLTALETTGNRLTNVYVDDAAGNEGMPGVDGGVGTPAEFTVVEIAENFDNLTLFDAQGFTGQLGSEANRMGFDYDAPLPLGSTFLGNATITGAQGDNWLGVYIDENADINLALTTFDGDDDLVIDKNLGLHVGTQGDFNTITVDAGEGDNRVQLWRLASDALGTAVDITTGDGDDEIDVRRLSTDGAVLIDAGGGNNDISVYNSFVWTEIGSLAISAGQGYDAVTVDRLWIDGALTVDVGDGGSYVNIGLGLQGSGVDIDGTGTALLINAGNGSNQIYVRNVEVDNGSASITTGDGYSYLYLLDMDVDVDVDISIGDYDGLTSYIYYQNSEIGGNVSVESGNANDFIYLGNLDIGDGALGNGNLTVNAGSGNNTIQLVDVVMTGHADDTTTVEITTLEGNDVVLLDNVVSDYASVDTGAGDDVVHVLGGQFDDIVVDTADGNDIVVFDGVNLDNSSITVDTGTGDDIIGYFDTDPSILSVDGGEGFDTFIINTSMAFNSGILSQVFIDESGGDLIPGDDSTGYTIDVGMQVGAEINSNGDRDWFAVDLYNYVPYLINVLGAPTGSGTLNDPYLRVYDDASVLVDFNDDGGDGLNARLEFTPDYTGTHYLEASRWLDAGTGTYLLDITLGDGVPNTPVLFTNIEELVLARDGEWQAVDMAILNALAGSGNIVEEIWIAPVVVGSDGITLVENVDTDADQTVVITNAGLYRQHNYLPDDPTTNTFDFDTLDWEVDEGYIGTVVVTTLIDDEAPGGRILDVEINAAERLDDGVWYGTITTVNNMLVVDNSIGSSSVEVLRLTSTGNDVTTDSMNIIQNLDASDNTELIRILGDTELAMHIIEDGLLSSEGIMDVRADTFGADLTLAVHGGNLNDDGSDQILADTANVNLLAFYGLGDTEIEDPDFVLVAPTVTGFQTIQFGWTVNSDLDDIFETGSIPALTSDVVFDTQYVDGTDTYVIALRGGGNAFTLDNLEDGIEVVLSDNSGVNVVFSESNTLNAADGGELNLVMASRLGSNTVSTTNVNGFETINFEVESTFDTGMNLNRQMNLVIDGAAENLIVTGGDTINDVSITLASWLPTTLDVIDVRGYNGAFTGEFENNVTSAEQQAGDDVYFFIGENDFTFTLTDYVLADPDADPPVEASIAQFNSIFKFFGDADTDNTWVIENFLAGGMDGVDINNWSVLDLSGLGITPLVPVNTAVDGGDLYITADGYDFEIILVGIDNQFLFTSDNLAFA
jgi:hypothetical protein